MITNISSTSFGSTDMPMGDAMPLNTSHVCSKGLLSGPADKSYVSPVSQFLESVPASVQQDAVRGQALLLKQQGGTAAAQQLLADLVQSAERLECMCQHLAQADYGNLLLEQGNLQVLFYQSILSSSMFTLLFSRSSC